MCIKVHEELVEEKNGSCKLCLRCQREKNVEKRHMKKKLKEKKSEKKEKYKAKNMHDVKKIEAQVRMKGKWAKKVIYAHIYFFICSTSFIDSL